VARAASAVREMATRNPTTNVRVARAMRTPRRRTSARPSAATAMNSGPRIIAPMTRIWESTTMAMLASNVARVMNER
jgi:hypothetical protein